MISSPSMSELHVSPRVLEALVRTAYRELGLSVPDIDADADLEQLRRYLSSNPDITPERLAQALAEAKASATLAPNVVDLTVPATRSILNRRVHEIEPALAGLDPGQRFARTCFGTIPGGGLDAASFKIDGANEYAVVIPDGFFHLTNLLTKLVILLQPMTPTPNGPVFTPSASLDQLDRLQHPYVVFRYRDLLEGFFLWGDPKAALPYPMAIPYQDRFAYLVVGTELFVLAHELAHVVLGHLDRPTSEDAEALELQADTLALKIVTAYFRSKTDYPVARARLCGFLFISMVKIWEAGLERLTGDPKISQSHTHPVSSARFKNYASALEGSGKDETPAWYIHTHNAIRYLTELMLPEALEAVANQLGSADGVSARVLPQDHQHLGHLNVSAPSRWWVKLAGMIGGPDADLRRIGLWMLVAHLPTSAVGLYRGIVDDDDVVRKQSEAALVSIEPMYASYIPRLRERYREAAKADDFDRYLFQLSMYLGAAASAKMGEAKEMDPMDPRFLIQPKAADEN